VGVAILDYAKQHMQKMHHSVLKRYYKGKAKLLYTDTDSLKYLIETPDLHADFEMMNSMGMMQLSGHTQIFDMTGTGRPALHDREVGLFKDETIKEDKRKFTFQKRDIFRSISLGAKMYTDEMYDESCRLLGAKHKGKGIPKNTLATTKTVQSFLDALLHPEVIDKVSFKTLRSVNHVAEKRHMTKRGLTADTDKVYLISPFASRPLGHWRNLTPTAKDVHEQEAARNQWAELRGDLFADSEAVDMEVD
jgi:hypothetical protein